MKVVKRDGRREDVHMDKITARIRNLCDGLDARFIDPVRGGARALAEGRGQGRGQGQGGKGRGRGALRPRPPARLRADTPPPTCRVPRPCPAIAAPPRGTRVQVAVAMKVVAGIYDGVTTRELDQLAAETCAWTWKGALCPPPRLPARRPPPPPPPAPRRCCRRLLVDHPPRLVGPRGAHCRVGPPQDDGPSLQPQRAAPAGPPPPQGEGTPSVPSTPGAPHAAHAPARRLVSLLASPSPSADGRARPPHRRGRQRHHPGQRGTPGRRDRLCARL